MNELERFKRDIDLTAFAASRGYRLDKRESSVSSRVLRHDGTGDKLIVGKAPDGHWRYFSVRDTTDNGSIIDFLQRRGRKNLGEVRRELREWLRSPPPLELASFRAPVQPPVHDRAAIARTLAAAKLLESHPYLEARGLRRETLSAERFRGTWRRDSGPFDNVLFPHRDAEGLSGFEVKNRGFSGFARGGKKGLWVSRAQPSDERLVITESAIDALSYHQIHGHSRARYASFAGGLNSEQPALLDRAIGALAPGGVVIAATDNDKDGKAFAARIELLCSKHDHIRYERHAPQLGKDWNDQLQALAHQRRTQEWTFPSRGLER